MILRSRGWTSPKGFLALDSENPELAFKNHPTVLTDRTSGVTEHYGLVRSLNARARFAPATHASNARARGGTITQSC